MPGSSPAVLFALHCLLCALVQNSALPGASLGDPERMKLTSLKCTLEFHLLLLYLLLLILNSTNQNYIYTESNHISLCFF